MMIIFWLYYWYLFGLHLLLTLIYIRKQKENIMKCWWRNIWKKMKKRYSLLTDNMKKCYITGSTQDIHIHEVYYGSADRKKSIEYGCCVPLRADYHNMSNYGVHFNKALDLRLKREMQEAFEKKYSHEKFMEVFHKNYL